MTKENTNLDQSENGNDFIADVMHCCEIDCKENAVFNLQDIGKGKTYEDYTHCCSEHLVEMIAVDSIYEVSRL